MNPDTQHAHEPAAPVSDRRSKRESAAFYVFLATMVFAPLAFWPTPYMALESVKTFVIVIGVLVSALLYLGVSMKERQAVLPPKSLLWSAGAIAVLTIISALASSNISKSLFGQGFELGTASFIVAQIVAAGVAFAAVRRRPERAVIAYVGVIASFFVLYLVHAIRFISGSVDVLSLGILRSLTATPFGNWYSFGMYAALVIVVTISAVLILPLSRRMKVAYWTIIVLGLIGMLAINNVRAWAATAIIFLGIAVHLTARRPRPSGNAIVALVKRISWVPLVVCIVAAIFAWKGPAIIGPAIDSAGASHVELSLPWQLSVDVISDALKTDPIFGVGPNRFSQAYLAHKPEGVNLTPAWGVEFGSAFGLLPTFVATQGILGAMAWLLFLVFFGVAGVRSLRRLPVEPHVRFIVVSSYASASLLWISSIIYVPSHVLIFYAAAFTGIWAGASVSYGSLVPVRFAWADRTGRSKFAAAFLGVCILVVAVWGLWQAKKTVALAYFGVGVHELTASGDSTAADQKFRVALALDPSDVYWQARAEAGVADVTKKVNAALSAGAAIPQEDAAAIGQELVETLGYAQKAIEYDPDNYYNYLSAARVSELAAGLRMEQAADSVLVAYQQAIMRNPENPAIYLSLARFLVSQNRLDEALQTVGAAIQTKNNYLEAIYLLSQIEAAKGDIGNAIIAAKVAVQINPQNPLLFFQLGLLLYTNKDFAGSAEALAAAVTLQPDYANAKYFLGLSYAQIGRRADAVAIFAELADSNPDNQEVALILGNLQAGRQPFANPAAEKPVAPEKRSSLPVKEKGR